ncbi:MAG: metal transporter ATP-binding protein [Verrucomicrobiales bacterium]|nr:metal transporter ATP-binding protein [Verrucomicrobiales bacterium]
MSSQDIPFHRRLAIDLKDVHVRLGDNPVLRGVSLRIAPGKLVALIGPNGSGKTTLLRAILGLQPVTSGEVRLFGEKDHRKTSHRIGYVPQKLPLDRSFILTVREFLALRQPSTRHWFFHRSKTTDATFGEVVSDLGIGPWLSRPVSHLSGGQLQRVLIAYALLKKPDLLLLDEPTAGIDTPGEATFYELISNIHKKLGMTIVLVSHDLSMVFRHASWVYALNGTICCEGTPEEIMNADSLKQAYGIHVSPYHHHHHAH